MANQQTHSTRLKAGSVGVLGIMFFVLSAQAPLTGIIGPTPITIALGNGAGAPAASLLVGLVIVVFSVGFTEMSRRLNVHGAFYAYIMEAMGPRIGTGAAWIAILAYGAVQGGMYGLYGFATSMAVSDWFGLHVPWWVYVLVTIALVQVLGSRNIELGAKILSTLVILEFLIVAAFGLAVMFSGGGPEGLDFGASFSPQAVLSGAPGIAVLFAVASMVGFESTAIYSSEAKNPQRTVPLATYLAVAVVAFFYAWAIWMVVSYYGPSHVVDAAASTLEGDTTMFVISAMSATLGPWVDVVVPVLLITSLLAGIIAFHNGVNRYLHSLANRGALPRVLARVNRSQAPAWAAALQSVMAILTVTPFVIAGLDPSITLFPWGGGIAVAALLVLYLLCSFSVILFFRREKEPASRLRTQVAPMVAIVMLLGLAVLVVSNFDAMIGGDRTLANLLLLLIPLFFMGGVLSTRLFTMDGPITYEPGPFRQHADDASAEPQEVDR